MSQRHARIIEKDIISDLQPTQGGDGEIVDMFGSSGGCEKLSCQFVYDVLSFSPVGVVVGNWRLHLKKELKND